MKSYMAGEMVNPGIYVSPTGWDIIKTKGGILSGIGKYLKVPMPLLLLLAPILGFAFVIFLPLIGFLMLIYAIMEVVFNKIKRYNSH
jgi:phage shock protein PspC (stress-responsive transcriptional regulator)